jgi:MFS family permease
MTASANRWWTLGAVCVATFMLLLDITIVNVALPAITRSLHASFTDLQWVIDAYALSLAALLLTWGSTSDRVGRRAIFVVGLGLFTLSSLGCGLAWSPVVLNVARALQGIGGAAMFATSLALLAAAFQGRERGTAFGVWGATTGAAVAVGPLVGGLLTDSIGWERAAAYPEATSSSFLLQCPATSRRGRQRDTVTAPPSAAPPAAARRPRRRPPAPRSAATRSAPA